jgi:ketosteroid isomerase-like protein
MILLALLAASARAGNAGDDRQAIVKLEHDWLAALQQHDRTTLQRILADDFTDITVSGVSRDKAAALAGSSVPAGTTQAVQDLHIRVHGDTAIATGLNVVHSTTQGWTAEVAFTDVFVRNRGQWQALSAQETLRPRPSAKTSGRN